VASAETDRALKRAVFTLVDRVGQTPRDAEAALALAEALRRVAARTPEPAARVRHLEKACQADPYDVETRLRLAAAREAAGAQDDALAALVAVTRAAPGDPRAWERLGQAYLARARRRPSDATAGQAIAAFEEALARDPQSLVALFGRLEAACCAKVTAPAKSRLTALLPSALLAIRPSPELVPALARLAVSLAYAIHYPKHLPTSKKLTPADVTARQNARAGLDAGLAPWSAAFPEDRRLRAARAAVALFAAEAAALLDCLSETAPALAREPRMLHLVLHQKLEELREPQQRVEVMERLAAIAPFSEGLERELLAVLNAASRTAVRDGNPEAAADVWSRGHRADPTSPAPPHNLALLALHRKDLAEYAAQIASTVDRLVLHWILAPDGRAYLERLAARHECLADRLGQAVFEASEKQEVTISPDLLETWLGERRAALVLRAFLLCQPDARAEAGLRDDLIAFLRGQTPFADLARRLPDSLLRLLDVPLSGRPLLHYAVLDVETDATPADIDAQLDLHRRQLVDGLSQAREAGDEAQVALLRERLNALAEAHAALGSPAARAAYDAACIPAEEHRYHLARRQHVVELHELAQRLAGGDRRLVANLCRAFEEIPHEGLGPYFDLIQKDALRAIRRNLLHVRFAAVLEEVQSLMAAEQWREAYELLAFALGDGADDLGFVHYLLAICELRLEAAAVEKTGRLTAPGVPIEVGARKRLAELPAGEE
jgi:hypothetical protein